MMKMMNNESFLERDILGSHKSYVSGHITASDKSKIISEAVIRFLGRSEGDTTKLEEYWPSVLDYPVSAEEDSGWWSEEDEEEEG